MKKLRNLLIAAVLICTLTALLLPVQAGDGVEDMLVDGIQDFYTEMEMWREYFADGALPEKHFRYSLHREVINGELTPYFTFTETSDGYWEYAVGSVPAAVLEEVAGRHYTRQDAVVDYLRNLKPDWEFTEWFYADGYYHIKVEPAGYAPEHLSAFVYQGYELLEDGSYVLYGHRVKRYDSTTGELFTPGPDDVLGQDYLLASFEDSHPTWQATAYYGEIQDQAVKAVMQVKNGTYAFTSMELIDRGDMPAQLQGTPAQPEIWGKTDGLYASTEVNEETVGLTLYAVDNNDDYSAIVALRGTVLAAYRFVAEQNSESTAFIDTPVELRFAVPEGCTEPAVYYIPENPTAPSTVLGTLEGDEYVCQVHECGTYVLCQDTNGQTALEELLLEAENGMNFYGEVFGEYFADGQLPHQHFRNQFYAACLHGELTPWFTFTYYNGDASGWQNVQSGVADIPAEIVEKAMGRHFTHQDLVVERLRNFSADGYHFKTVTYADGMYHIEVGGAGGMGDPSPIFYYLGYEVLEDGSYAVYGWRAEYLDEETWETYVPGPEDVLGEDYVYATQCWFNDKDTVYQVTAGKILDESVRMVVTLKDNTYAYTSYELIHRNDIPADLLGNKTETTVGTATQNGTISSTDPNVLRQVYQFGMWQVTDTAKIDLVLQSYGQTLAAFDIMAMNRDYQIIPNFQGEMELRLPIPEGCVRPGLFYVSDDGKTVEEIPGEIAGDQFVCTLTHLSTYVLCEKPCPHEGEWIHQKDATCLEAGYTGDLICKLCGELVEEGTAIPADPENGHKWLEEKVEPGCETQGYIKDTCAYCGDSNIWYLPPLGHTGDPCQRCGDTAKKPGDANGNGEVDNIDALIVLQYAVGLVQEGEYDFSACDLNGDGDVDNIDALMILQIAVGLLKL